MVADGKCHWVWVLKDTRQVLEGNLITARCEPCNLQVVPAEVGNGDTVHHNMTWVVLSLRYPRVIAQVRWTVLEQV